MAKKRKQQHHEDDDPIVRGSTTDVLEPDDDAFDAVARASYDGFVVDAPSTLPESLHQDVERALRSMLDRGEFTHDILSAGNKVSSTFVRRVLLGKRGATYHYQRLRLFAVPWEDEHTDRDSPHRVMRRLNEALIERSAKVLSGTRHAESKHEYNVTLINYMDTERASEVELKEETLYGLGTTSVSWHSDSSLQTNSTVAVYHLYDAPERRDWCVALRTLDDSAPALRVPLQTRATYYMCGDFNATHHHAVLTGTSSRFSSTHRVGVVAKDTFKYIKNRCVEALALVNQLETADRIDSKSIQHIAEVHREVEFQWIRMFYLQGKEHAELHAGYWRGKIEELTEAWDRFELTFRRVLSKLKRGSQPPRAYAMMIYVLETIKELRDEYKKRLSSPAYGNLPEGLRPMTNSPPYDDTSPLPFELSPVLRSLRSWKQKFNV